MIEIWEIFIMVENAMQLNHVEDKLRYEPCTYAKALPKKMQA
jgi:hypothetical protein